MRRLSLIDEIITAITAESEGDFTRLMLQQVRRNHKSTSIVLAFGKSDHLPLGQILPCYQVTSSREEQLLLRGPFEFAEHPPKVPKHLSSSQLRKLAGDRLARLFPDGAFYIPIPSTALGSPKRNAGAIIFAATDTTGISTRGLALAQLGMSIMLLQRDANEADRRLDEQHFFALSRRLEECNTRRELCKAVLDCVDRFIPYQSGVLYLVDPDPGRNEYLIYGASRNEHQVELYRSFYLREDLGFTWEVAMAQKPRVGSYADVPSTARRTNDEALKHLKRVHEAWALLPLTAQGQTIAVVHAEGLNFGNGASAADLEVMRRLANRLGNLLHSHLHHGEPRNSRHPSITVIEQMYDLFRSASPTRRERFEEFIRHLFASLDGIQEVQVRDQTRTTPQIDGLFLFSDRAGSFVVEIKAPDHQESKVGVQALRQLIHQMESVGGSLGILVSMAKFGSRTKNTVTNKRILILDRPRVERLCALSPEDRRLNVSRWFELAKPGVHFAEIG
jgi:hypothetical protein